MIGYGMIYAAAVGLPVLLAAIAGSAALRRYGRPERGVWLVALGLALVLPVVFLVGPLGGGLGESEILSHTGPPVGATETLTETGVLGLPAVVTISVEQSGLGLDEMLLLAWLLASLALSLRWAVAAYRLARAGRSWRTETVDGVRVWLTSDLGPAVSGVVRTRILVPSWLASLPEEQRSLVLLHEEEHIRAKDPVLLAVSRIARILAPWNPVVWRLSSQLLHAVELDCDRRVLGRRPDIGTYGDTLLTVSARDSGPLVAAAAFAESEVPLRKRIVAMTTPPRSVSTLGVLTVLALGVVLLIGSCEVPVPKVAEGVIVPRTVQAGRGDNPLRTAESEGRLLRIEVERDGSIRLNDTPVPMAAVSPIVAPLYAESGVALVVSIVADHDVPYEIMDQLQQELVTAGPQRVVFRTVDSAMPASTSVSPSDRVPSLWDRGLAIALRTVRAVYEALESLAARSAPEDVPAPEDEGLALVLPEQIPGGVQVSQFNVMHISPRPDGLVEVRRGVSLQVQIVAVRDIQAIWRQDVAENRNLIASVETYPDTPYKYMVDVLEALQAADAERISLTTLENTWYSQGR